MITMNVHRIDKVHIVNKSCRDGSTKWADYRFFDVDGNIILEVGAFGIDGGLAPIEQFPDVEPKEEQQ